MPSYLMMKNMKFVTLCQGKLVILKLCIRPRLLHILQQFKTNLVNRVLFISSRTKLAVVIFYIFTIMKQQKFKG